jgi:hypothetical protein
MLTVIGASVASPSPAPTPGPGSYNFTCTNCGTGTAATIVQIVLAAVAVGALIANAVVAVLMWRAQSFDRQQAAIARRRSLPWLGIDDAPSFEPDSSKAYGDVRYTDGTDRAVNLRVLVRRGQVYWFGSIDRPLIPGGERGKFGGPGSFRADRVDEGAASPLVRDMPSVDGLRDGASEGAVIATWTAPDMTKLWCAQRYELGNTWVPFGSELRGADPPA